MNHLTKNLRCKDLKARTVIYRVNKMGIPVYFKTLITDYQDTIIHKGKLNDIQSVFFDLNCLIHPCKSYFMGFNFNSFDLSEYTMED